MRRIGRDRREAMRAAAELDQRAGEVAGLLVDEYGVSKNAVARTLGISQPHVTALIQRSATAERSGIQEDIPVLSTYEAVGYLSDTKQSISRVIAGFYPLDVLIRSELDPERFREGWSLQVPHMLWQIEDGSWIGIDEVNVGYGPGGTGPSAAYRALTDAGVHQNLAASAYERKFFDLDLAKGSHSREGHGPHRLQLPTPQGPAYVVKLEREDLRGTYEHDEDKDQPTPEPVYGKQRTAYEAWIGLLDEPALPAWLEGPRVGRVFSDPEAAREQGFTTYGSVELRRGNAPFQLIVEQGRLQLWVPIYPPLDPTQLLSDEAYRALDDASLYPEHLARLDERGRLVRYLELIVRRQRPAFFDVSPGGKGKLSYVPLREEH